jgi:glutathione peroxidase
MLRRLSVSRVVPIAIFGALALSLWASPAKAAAPTTQEAKPMSSVLGFKMKNLSGQEVDLKRYQGDVVLIVNTASKCGFTPQYKALEALHEKYHEKGLSILGFPANNFHEQEPGTNAEIGEFCRLNYGVKFDMFSKISVKGDDKAPLYSFLTDPATDPEFAGDIRWNFEKFLVGRDGKVIARFGPPVAPDSKEVVDAVEAALARK